MAVHFSFFSNDIVRQRFEGLPLSDDARVNRCASIENLNDKLAIYTSGPDCDLSKPLIFLDSGTIESFASTANSAIESKCRIVLINTYEDMADYLLRINDRFGPSHLVNLHDENFKNKIGNILSAYQKLDMGSSKDAVIDIFLKDAVDFKKVNLHMSSERWAIYEDVQKFLEGLDCFPDFSNIAITIASELLTNAFYHAPTSQVNIVPGHTNRTSIITIPAPDLVHFVYGKTPDYLWLAVCDPFGNLNRKIIGEAIFRALKQRTAILTGTGGAGLGMAMMLTMSSEVLFAVDSKKKTWVACKLLLTKRNKAFASQKVEYHLF